MKVLGIFILFALFGCSTANKNQTGVREPAEAAPVIDRSSSFIESGEPAAMGALTDRDLHDYARKLCWVVDGVQGNRQGVCRLTLNGLLQSRFNPSAPSPSRMDLTSLICEAVPRKDYTDSYYLVRFYCLKNAFSLWKTPEGRYVNNQCGHLASNDDPSAEPRGDCYKKLMLGIADE